MTGIRDAIDAVTEAGGAFTRDVGTFASDDPATGLEPALQRLQRATSRLATILLMHPELTFDDALPRGAWSDDDAADRAMSIDALETAASMPSEPVTVFLRTRASLGESREDAVREWIGGFRIEAIPDSFAYTADVTALVSQLTERFIPPEVDETELRDVDEGKDEDIPGSGPLRELRDRVLRPRTDG